MSDGRGFLVAAYVLTALTLLVYAVRLGMRLTRTERRLAELRSGTHTPRSREVHAEPDLESELVGGSHV